jgi:hypothetical protein
MGGLQRILRTMDELGAAFSAVLKANFSYREYGTGQTGRPLVTGVTRE